MRQYDKEKIDGATYAKKMLKLVHSVQKKKKWRKELNHKSYYGKQLSK